MNFRTTIVLLVLLAGIGVFLFVTRDKPISPTGDTKVDSKKLIAIDAKDASRLVIAPQDGKRVVFDRPEADWRIVEPVQGPADTYEVDGLVRDLLDLTSRRQIKLDDKASRGLDPPSYRVEITDRAGKTATINVGKKSPIGDDLYVLVEGHSTADIVPAGVYERLEKPYTAYRKTRVADLPTEQVRRIDIARPEGDLSLRKQGEAWEMTGAGAGAKALPADATAVSDLLFAVSGLTAVDFVAEDLRDAKLYQLDRPVLTVRLSKAAPSPPATTATASASTAPSTYPSTQVAAAASQPADLVIKFGRFEDARKKNVFVTVSDAGPVITVPASTLDAFRKSPLDLRDKKVLNIGPETVSELRLITDRAATTQPSTRPAEHKELALKRRSAPPPELIGPPAPGAGPSTTRAASQPATAPSSKWAIATPPTGDADDEKVQELLAALHPFKAEKFIEKSPVTQPAATYVLRLTQSSGSAAAPLELRITDPGPDATPVGTYQGLVFDVDRSFLDKFTADFTAPKEGAAPRTPPPTRRPPMPFPR